VAKKSKLKMHFAFGHDKDNGDVVAPIMLSKALECKGCHAMHMLFVNRNGQTRCVDCDRKFKEGKGQ